MYSLIKKSPENKACKIKRARDGTRTLRHLANPHKIKEEIHCLQGVFNFYMIFTYKFIVFIILLIFKLDIKIIYNNNLEKEFIMQMNKLDKYKISAGNWCIFMYFWRKKYMEKGDRIDRTYIKINEKMYTFDSFFNVDIEDRRRIVRGKILYCPKDKKDTSYRLISKYILGEEPLLTCSESIDAYTNYYREVQEDPDNKTTQTHLCNLAESYIDYPNVVLIINFLKYREKMDNQHIIISHLSNYANKISLLELAKVDDSTINSCIEAIRHAEELLVNYTIYRKIHNEIKKK